MWKSGARWRARWAATRCTKRSELGAALLERPGRRSPSAETRIVARVCATCLSGSGGDDRAGELLRELRREPVKVAEASHHVELAELELRQRRPRRHLVRVVRRDAVAHLARVQHRDRQVGRGGVGLRLRRRREPRRRRRRRDVDVEQRLAAKRLGRDGGRVRGGRRRARARARGADGGGAASSPGGAAPGMVVRRPSTRRPSARSCRPAAAPRAPLPRRSRPTPPRRRSTGRPRAWRPSWSKNSAGVRAGCRVSGPCPRHFPSNSRRRRAAAPALPLFGDVL